MTEPRQCEGPQDPFCSLKQYVPVPVEGEWFVDNGKVRKITESEWTDSDDLCEGFQIWAERVPGECRQCGQTSGHKMDCSEGR